MAMKREVRCTYLAVLKENAMIVGVDELINFYEDYAKFRQKMLNNTAAPNSLKAQLQPISMPQYVEWLKKMTDK